MYIYFIHVWTLLILYIYDLSTSSMQRLIHPRYRLKILSLIKTFNDEICKEDEGNLWL